MPDYATIIMVIVIVLTILYFANKYLPIPKCVGPSNERSHIDRFHPKFPPPPPLPASVLTNKSPDQPRINTLIAVSPHELDVWIDVFELAYESGKSTGHAAGEADRAVKEFLARYRDHDDDADEETE